MSWGIFESTSGLFFAGLETKSRAILLAVAGPVRKLRPSPLVLAALTGSHQTPESLPARVRVRVHSLALLPFLLLGVIRLVRALRPGLMGIWSLIFILLDGPLTPGMTVMATTRHIRWEWLHCRTAASQLDLAGNNVKEWLGHSVPLVSDLCQARS